MSLGGPPWLDDAPSLLPDILRRAATDHPESGIFHLGPDDSITSQRYPALLDEARRLAGGLEIEPGEPVLLQLRESGSFLPSFWAILLAGGVAVPLAIPRSHEPDEGPARRLRTVWERLGSPVILVEPGDAAAVRDLLPGDGRDRPRVCTLASLGRSSRARSGSTVDPQDPAILLPTSGSTGAPKLVLLSHRNVLASIAGSARVNRFGAGEVSLNWLTLCHVGALFRSLRETLLGCRQIQGPTERVLAEPLLWLDWLDRFRVTTSWAPNFAFERLLQRLDEGGDEPRWNLAAMKSLWSSGEMVMPSTVRALARRLAAHGLRPEALHAAWGMTEACFATYSHSCVADLEAGETFTPLGRPIPGISLRIVDGEDRLVPEGTAGRLQIRGEVCSSGYHESFPTEEPAFTEDGWLRTGDRGWLRGGRLVLTGRDGNTFVRHGLTFSCSEIEASLGEGASEVAVCIVGAEGSQNERLALVFESAGVDLQREGAALQGRLSRRTGIRADLLVPLGQGEMPRTAVGKLDRASLRRRIESGVLAPLPSDDPEDHEDARSPPLTEIQRRVARVFAAVLGLGSVGRRGHFFELGGSSLQAVEVVARLQQLFPGRTLAEIDLLQTPTVFGLAERLDRSCVDPEPAQEGRERGERRRGWRSSERGQARWRSRTPGGGVG